MDVLKFFRPSCRWKQIISFPPRCWPDCNVLISFEQLMYERERWFCFCIFSLHLLWKQAFLVTAILWAVKENGEARGDEYVLRSHYLCAKQIITPTSFPCFSHFYSARKLARWRWNNSAHKAVVCACECDTINCVRHVAKFAFCMLCFLHSWTDRASRQANWYSKYSHRFVFIAK